MEGLFQLFIGALMLLALCMLILGPIQLIWAVIHPLVSKNNELRKQFGYYWMGVLIYFAVIIPMRYLSDLPFFQSTIFAFFGLSFFFVGGIALAVFHFQIVSTNGSMKQADNDIQEIDDIDFAV